jgi:Domain of unknown function (DUF4956)
MVHAVMITIDLVAIAVLTFGLYFRRHRRRDLVVAYLTVNVGVLAVALVLGTTTVGLGLGLGLFGVLSIIRLRSSEISQHEVAYYFAALAVGLLAGLSGISTAIDPLVIALIVLIVLVMLIGDSPRLFARYRQQVVVLDAAYTDEVALRAALESMLGATVHGVTVQHLDLVNDSTTVDVRYQLTASMHPAAQSASLASAASTR